MSGKIKKVVALGMLSAIALILSYVESLLPPIYAGIPGIKMGLPNIVVVFLLYGFSYKEAFLVSMIRVLAVSFLFGNASTFLYSITGAILSLVIMVILKKTNIFSTAGVSIAGGIFHNVGQILMAMLLLGTKEIGYYMLILLITGSVAGAFIGILGSFILSYSRKIGLISKNK
jgi:heptaprenyl diphosphate synthase